MTKKEVMRNEKIQENLQFGKFSTESEIVLGNRGKSETGGKCTIASWGMNAPDIMLAQIQ